MSDIVVVALITGATAVTIAILAMITEFYRGRTRRNHPRDNGDTK